MAYIFGNEENNNGINEEGSIHGDGGNDQPLVYFVDTITYDTKYGYQNEQSKLGTGITIEYSFAETPDRESSYGFTTFSQEQKESIRTALDCYAKLTNLDFVEVDNNSVKLDFSFYYYDFTGVGGPDLVGYSYYGGYGGGVYFNTQVYNPQINAFSPDYN